MATTSLAATLTFPLPADGDRSRYSFEFELLQAALNASQTGKTEADQLRWSTQNMTQGRARIEVAAGNLSVVHSYATPELDQQLTPVPFSLDKGLNSQRILLTRRSLLPKLAAIRSADDLRDLRFGVLGSWSDRRLLQGMGFKVETTESFSGLFKMLGLGRSDVIMSGLLHMQQVTPFMAEPSDLEWEPTLLITVPSQQRFYTARTAEGEALAKRLLRGLQRLQASGEFDRLHTQHFGEQISAGNGRRVIHLLDKNAAALSPPRQ
ncbi:hypothetical protein WG899_10275 [Paucibacter sp. AS339]|uniref:substrate-binding periplasmic protein n=1 Tax=Paucibacter hankyongi TaxID=3133434 RepID=UPI0030B55324